jgi:ABC-type lipoprotein export system ATPase subunit
MSSRAANNSGSRSPGHSSTAPAVLADEPTGSLDAENGATVLALLRGLSGRAVMIVTHEPEAAGIADRVLQLGDGELEARAMAS